MAKYAVSPDLKYVLFAYDVKPVSSSDYHLHVWQWERAPVSLISAYAVYESERLRCFRRLECKQTVRALGSHRASVCLSPACSTLLLLSFCTVNTQRRARCTPGSAWNNRSLLLGERSPIIYLKSQRKWNKSIRLIFCLTAMNRLRGQAVIISAGRPSASDVAGFGARLSECTAHTCEAGFHPFLDARPLSAETTSELKAWNIIRRKRSWKVFD